MKAITIVDRALVEFQRKSGMTPKVILLPWRLFEKYAREREALDSILPNVAAYKPDDEHWSDVRVVEHEAIEEIEVY